MTQEGGTAVSVPLIGEQEGLQKPPGPCSPTASRLWVTCVCCAHAQVRRLRRLDVEHHAVSEYAVESGKDCLCHQLPFRRSLHLTHMSSFEERGVSQVSNLLHGIAAGSA